MYENPFSLSNRRSGNIHRPKAPELGPEEDRRSSCRGATASEGDFKLQASIPNSTPCSSDARRKSAKLCFLSHSTGTFYSIPGSRMPKIRASFASTTSLPQPSCIHTGYETEKVWNPRKLRRAQVVWIASFPSCFLLLSLSDNDTNGAAVTFPPLGQTCLSAYGMLRYSL